MRKLLVTSAALALTACGNGAPPRALPTSAAHCAFDAKLDGSQTRGADLLAEVHTSLRGDELCVDELYANASSAPVDFHVGGRVAPFVRDLAVLRGDTWTPVPEASRVVPCASPGCRVRYRFMLREAAARFDSRDLAQADGDAIFSPSSTWLLHPRAAAKARYRVHVATTPPLAFVNGVFRAAGAADTYEGFLADLGDAPYAGFGPFRVTPIAVPGATIDLATTPALPSEAALRITRFVEQSARTVADYYGSYPVPRALVIVRSSSDAGMGSGTTMGEGGASIMLEIGSRVSDQDLREDWILVHEMVHVSFPSVSRPWAEEGLATYLEPVMRARMGLLDPDQVWRDLILGLPKGQPEPGDEGLDKTDSWGRRYWGGAAFWFLADVGIRKATQNKMSLREALRGVVAAGGTVAVTWKLEDTLAVADRAVGLTVFQDLHRSMAPAAKTVDLDHLFAELGVGLRGRRVVYDDTAPLADVRRAITAR